ncbi:voltage-dependent calcium channel subunit alpha-2/delta-1-like [Artemia franciscana]|uniref:voltage-dependent calcium channel subunit alpha-2/delta-1-like n=1 Tax=Artemia franciscana TaxID=6661 RepID=UPI0032DB9C18
MSKNVYTFALSPNGMVLYHPSLADYTNVLEDPLLFDILDLEPDNPEIEFIRKEMIDRQSGSKVVDVPFFSGDYAYRERRTYHYRPIGNSTYSFCLVVPEKYLRVAVEPTKKTRNNTLLDLYARDVLREKNASLLIAPWAQCSFGSSLRISTIEGQNGRTHVFDRTLNNCDSSVVQHLYWDLDVALSAVKTWHRQGKGSSRFIATQGGLAFVQNQRSSFVSSSLSDIHKDAIYQRISRADTNVIAGIVSKQDDGKLKVKSVIGSRVLLTHKLSNLTQILAAVGVELPPYIFRRIMFDETIQNEKSFCNNKEEVNCFLLDEAAQVVASNRDDISIGSFLGSEEADPQLMAALASGVTNVYDQVVQHRPLASCKKWVNSNPCSSAGILPTLSMLHSSVARVLVSLVVNTFAFIHHCFTSVFIVLFPIFGIREVNGGNALTDIGLDFLRPPKITTRLCSTRSASYRLILNSESKTLRASVACPGTSLETVEILNDTKTTVRSFEGNGHNIIAEKGECRRDILAKRIPELNLLLVVTQAACPCSSKHGPLLHEPIEESEIKVCNSRGRYRRKLALCYATNPKEKFQECNLPQSSSGWCLCNTYSISFLLMSLLFVCN